MFKAITYISATLLITGIVVTASNIQLATAQTASTSASSTTSATFAPIPDRVITTQAASASATVNGKTVSNSVNSTTILEPPGKSLSLTGNTLQSVPNAQIFLPGFSGVNLPTINLLQN